MTYLFLHGFTGSGASWRKLITLSGLNASQFITPDLPGHGANLPADPAAYAMEATAEAIIQGLDISSPYESDPLHLYGYSMGGRLALYLALTFPERFASLTLESASPGLRTEEERAARRASDEALAQRIEQNGVEAFVAEWEKLSLWDSQTQTLTPAQKTALHDARLRNDPQGLANSLHGLGTGAQPSLWERVWEIRMPCLLITGEYDYKFSAISHEMQMECPRAERIVIANAGHAVHLEQPRAVLDVWMPFVGL